ncbi:unnamed protein product, partial [Effrenium voratum]
MPRFVLKHHGPGSPKQLPPRDHHARRMPERRAPYESLPHCNTAEEYISMIGSGRSTIAECATLARANLKDNMQNPALVAFGSLGAHGSCESNQERDLHRWLRHIHGFQLAPYRVAMKLHVPGKAGLQDVSVPFVLPHEILHHVAMAGEYQVRDDVHETVARVLAWSMSQASLGVFPSVGALGEGLSGERGDLAGTVIANGWRMAYFGMKADAKARLQCNYFSRSYQHAKICESCGAAKQHKDWDPSMDYKDFYDDAPYLNTTISNEEYLRSSPRVSPWAIMPGWHLGTVFRDPMHTIYLGTAKLLISSVLGLWISRDILAGSDLAEKLSKFSVAMKRALKSQGMRVPFQRFTPANTGLDKPSQFPELGSAFKAANIKCYLWYISKKATEFAEASPRDTPLELIACCCWSLYRALHLLDRNDILLPQRDAE